MEKRLLMPMPGVCRVLLWAPVGREGVWHGDESPVLTLCCPAWALAKAPSHFL